jgi:elongation factor Tu
VSHFTPPTPEEKEERRRLLALPFRMVIEDVFTIKGRGVIVTGRVQAGLLEVGDPVFITGGPVAVPSRVVALEMFGSPEWAWVGDNIGVLLRNVEANYITRGMILTKQGEA